LKRKLERQTSSSRDRDHGVTTKGIRKGEKRDKKRLVWKTGEKGASSIQKERKDSADE